MTNRELISDEECRRASAVVDIVRKRWTGGVMLALARGATRFGEIEAVVEGISARMLSARLTELRHHDLVERVVTPTTPVSVSYRLTPRGRDVLGSLHDLARKEQQHQHPSATLAG